MKNSIQLPKCLTGYSLKVVAIISMVIDHFAYIPFAEMLSKSYDVQSGIVSYGGAIQNLFIFIAEHESIMWILNDILHWIGRLAFPLFCFLLVEGFSHTKSKAKYALRLGTFALISEIPYDMAFSGCIFDIRNNNVFFTLLTGFVMIWGISTIGNWLVHNTGKNILKRVIYIVAVLTLTITSTIMVSTVLDASYGASGVLTILIIFLMKKHPALAVLISTVVLSIFNMSFIELFAAPSALLVSMYNKQRGKPIKYFFYVFYPLHLLIFALIVIAIK